MKYEWGPWIEHDGRGCPVRGQLVTSVTRSGIEEVHIADKALCINGRMVGQILTDHIPSAWVWWQVKEEDQIVRYRVRRPRVTEWLEETTSDLPAKVDA